MGIRDKIKPLEMSCTDISENYQPYLDALFEMVQDLKVPGRKAKSYE
jgi:DNA phosphorothioation-dependent restriction protein DptG